MSKKLFVLFVAAAGLMCFTGSAMALTFAHTAAGGTKATQGDCSGCHIPHKAQGAQRLFPNVIGTTATYNFMGGMCAEYCHNQSLTVPTAYAYYTALRLIGQNSGAHGITASSRPALTSWGVGLPYLGAATTVKDSLAVTLRFECTTCHNPHKEATGDTSTALLQMDIDALCSNCHYGRGTGTAAWGAANYGAANSLGSHPVGTDVLTDASDPGNSPIYIGGTGAAGGTAFDTPYGASGSHNLGGHLINGGTKAGGAGIGMTCVTCHAVHGNCLDSDADYTPNDGSPFEDLLVINQGAMGSAEPARTGNGNGMATNALCESCHMYTTAATDTWNPGGKPGSHPCDANGGAGMDMGTLGAGPAGRPIGTTKAATMDFAVICETCHDPHGAAVNSHILAAAEATICDLCHTGTATPVGHHPVGSALMTTCGFSDANIGNGDQALTCNDCHNGSGAHNWSSLGAVGLDPQWEPPDNGRSTSAQCTTQEPADGTAKIQNCNVSKECVDCHVGTPSSANFSPTCNRNTSTLEDRGEGSHFLGLTNMNPSYDLDNGWLGAAFNAFHGDWSGTFTATAQSRFAGTATTQGNYSIVCESCHELEINRKNNTNNALLLYNYAEVLDEPVNLFCTGCHGQLPGGGGTHPLTGSTISKAVDDGRGTITLITATTGYANAATAPGNAEYMATANRLNCDSCHQTHDTETAGSTFILEFGATGTPTFGSFTLYGSAIAYRATTSAGILHQTLCTQCHNY